MKKSVLIALVALSSQAVAAQEAMLEQFTQKESVPFSVLIPGQEPDPEANDSPKIGGAQPLIPSDLDETASIELGARPARPYVPAWMRGGWLALGPRRSAIQAHFSDPGCLTNGYFPRFDISTKAQERRRLYFDHIRTAACEAGVPTPLFDALIHQESRYRPFAKSHAGAMGMAQLMPGTARYLNVSDPWDPLENLRGGARYLREQFDRYGAWDLALAAYNSGPGRVDKYGGVPPFRETRNYVRIILARQEATNSRFETPRPRALRSPFRIAQLAILPARLDKAE